MAEELFIPKLGQTVEEVTLINWLVKEGDKVEAGQGVLEVETDKAIFTVESPADGFIHLGPFKAGDVVQNLTIVALIGKVDEQFASSTQIEEQPKPEQTPDKTIGKQMPFESLEVKPQQSGRKFVSPRARKLAVEIHVDLNAVTPTGDGGMRIIERDILNSFGREVKVSPLAQRMAQEAGLDLRSLKGSGVQGEITKTDVELAIRTTKTGEVQPQMKPTSSVTDEVVQRVPLKGIRALIAERMSASVHTTARFTLFIEADATKLVNLRENLKLKVEKEWGFAPSYNDLIAKIAAKALRQFPYVNSRLADDVIEQLGHVHIGMATDTERGLMVPVIHDVDQKSLREFGSHFRQLVEQARSGRIALDDLKGGSFTITNLGNYDILTFVPVINLPEAAILAVGRITPKPVAVGDAIAIRQMWMLALVVDHRIVDGAPAAKFLQFIKDEIENPDEKIIA